MTDRDWVLALETFRACLPARGTKARDDLLFLKALHFFAVDNISRRALPDQFGHWNAVWKRFSRLSKAEVFEAFFAMLAERSRTGHVVQMFDSTVVRAHVSAAGAKGGPKRMASRPAERNRPRHSARTAVEFAVTIVGYKSHVGSHH